MRGDPIKVLIVDDSAFARRSLSSVLEKQKDIQIVATAANGEEGIAMVHKFDPDVVTMDVEMPRMDGLTALKRIMAEKPCPVIMISSLTSEGADTTLKALEDGALDFMPKISSHDLQEPARLERELTSKIRALARRKAFMRLVHSRKVQNGQVPARSASLAAAAQAAPRLQVTRHAMPQIVPGKSTAFAAVSIGVSTGGPPAVQKVLSALPENFPVPILIAQHMPAAFTGPFAKRLDAQCRINVKEAEPIERLRAGTAYICPGGKHLRLENRGGTLMGVVTDEPKEALYKPSANVLMETSAIALGRKALGVTLTGMGSDGLEGTKILKAKGGFAIAQSEATCVVYGMPKAVVDAQLADEIVDIDDMAAAIVTQLVK